MRICFALSGFHRQDRGAETALLAVAEQLARTGDNVTVIGSGKPRAETAYRFEHVPALPREKFERFPSLPFLRDETSWEDASFAFNLTRGGALNRFDVTITCAFPFTSLALRRARGKHVFVTENGDWPAYSDRSEYRLFDCDGLVCINPEYYERNRSRWNAALIPNGVDFERFRPGRGMREKFGLPLDKPVVLMVSAFIQSKRVLAGIEAMAQIPDAFLLVAGNGPMRGEADALASELIPGRYKRMTLSADEMPDLYRSADVFLHLSKNESFGNVYLEAGASGLPVVAHDYSITRWIFGNGAFLSNTDNRAALTNALRQALDAGVQPIDDELKRFAWPAISTRYREFMESIPVTAP